MDVFFANVTALLDIRITTGMLNITKSDAEIAAIMGHELAHVALEHFREECNRGGLEKRLILPWLPGIALDAVITSVGTFLSTVAGEAALLLIPGVALLSPAFVLLGVHLSNSRTKELEADFAGLLLMTEAGYDPAAAAKFWQEMGAREQRQFDEIVKRHGVGRVRRRSEWELTHPLVSLTFISFVRSILSMLGPEWL